MSAFDDEFGLFSDQAEAEPRTRLPARKIATESSGEEPQREAEERPRRRTRTQRPERREERPPKPQAQDPWAAPRRASELLEFLAKRLVAKPEGVRVELFTDEGGEAVVELVVDKEDLGRVIGRSGRVAHALRTLVRATAESRITVDIIDSEEAAEPLVGDG
ncbi:MAG: KH domain-containing protein [Candidatus Tyrphobacter sp.]